MELGEVCRKINWGRIRVLPQFLSLP